MANGMYSHLNVRLTQEERDAIRSRAESTGLGMNEYLHKRALQDDDRPIIRTDSEQLRRIYRSLRKAGGNLNQCARTLNTHHHPERISNGLEDALSAVARTSEDVSTFIADARNSI